LRFDRGGAFEAAVAAADQWLTDGVICRTLGRNRDEEYRADAVAPLLGLPTVVLVNGSTASASEVLAGALQDRQAALVVGEPTYGKGVVQELLPFTTWPGGMKLTVARYYTPSGRCVEARLLGAGETGGGRIRPDVPCLMDEAEREQLRRAVERFHWDRRVREAVEESEAALAGRTGRGFVDRQYETARNLLLARYADLGPSR
jgi:carboxyl-terminal processing protease